MLKAYHCEGSQTQAPILYNVEMPVTGGDKHVPRRLSQPTWRTPIGCFRVTLLGTGGGHPSLIIVPRLLRRLGRHSIRRKRHRLPPRSRTGRPHPIRLQIPHSTSSPTRNLVQICAREPRKLLPLSPISRWGHSFLNFLAEETGFRNFGFLCDLLPTSSLKFRNRIFFQDLQNLALV